MSRRLPHRYTASLYPTRPSVARPRVDRQAETEGAARARPVSHPNSSAMTLDNALGNEQTESHAPAIILGQLHEALKNRFQLIIGDAFSSVADATDNVVINVLEAYDDGALSGVNFSALLRRLQST